MSLSTSILNSDDNEWIQGRLLAEIQRLNARIDELEQDTLRKSENLNDLPEPELAVSNINYSYDGGSVINNVIQNTGGSSPGSGFSGSYNDLTDVPETIGKDSSVWFINDAPLGMYDGNDIFFASGTAASPTTATAGSAVGWLYSASRTISWQFDGSDLILGDAPVGSTPDGTNPIEYTPSATDSNREINFDVKTLLKGVTGATGQVIKADADGKMEWGDESSGGGGFPVLGTLATITSGTTWTVPSTASNLLVICIGGGGGGSTMVNSTAGFMASTSGGSPTSRKYRYRGSSGNGGDTAVGLYKVNGGESASISIGAGGSTAATGANGGATTFDVGSLNIIARGGLGGQSTGIVRPNNFTGSASIGHICIMGETGNGFIDEISDAVSVTCLGGQSVGSLGLNIGRGGQCSSFNLVNNSNDGLAGAIYIWHDG